MKPTHILVPVDLAESSRAGLRVAAELARQYGAAMTVIHVEMAAAVLSEAIAGYAEGRLDLDAKHAERVRTRVREFVQDVLGPEAEPAIEVVEDIFAAEAIVRFAVAHKSDWICMSAVGRRGARRLLLGNTATEVLRSSPVPVLTLRGHEEIGATFFHDDFRRILVAVDLDEGAKKIVAGALELAAPKGEVTVLHVIETPPELGLYGTPLRFPAEDVRAAREFSEIAICKLVEGVHGSVVAPVRVEPGRPADTILALEREMEPDLTVIGTHGRHGLDHVMLGSVAERVVRHARGPVLVIPTRSR